MATFSCPAFCTIHCSFTKENQDPNLQNINGVKIKIASATRSNTKVDTPSQKIGVASTSVASVTKNNSVIDDLQIRQNIPTKKQFIDPYRQGLIIESGVGYRQTVVIRSYEVGPDKTATLESILNLLQVIQFYFIELYMLCKIAHTISESSEDQNKEGEKQN